MLWASPHGLVSLETPKHRSSNQLVPTDERTTASAQSRRNQQPDTPKPVSLICLPTICGSGLHPHRTLFPTSDTPNGERNRATQFRDPAEQHPSQGAGNVHQPIRERNRSCAHSFG